MQVYDELRKAKLEKVYNVRLSPDDFCDLVRVSGALGIPTQRFVRHAIKQEIKRAEKHINQG